MTSMQVNRQLMSRNYGSPDRVDDFVETPEGKIHFVKQGSGHPVVLLHPLGTGTWVWEGTMERLSNHFTCYAFDALGHGLSDKPNRENFAVPDYARSIDHALQVLNVHRAHIVGNSFGAIQTIEIAASYPERVDRIVVVGLPVWDVRTAPALLKDIAELAQLDENGMPIDQTIDQQGAAFYRAKQEWVDLNNESRNQSGIWFIKTLTALAWYDIVARLPHIQASSAMVMFGEHDFLRDLAEDILRYNLPNCTKKILPDLAHIPQVEDPDTFVNTILPFLQ